MRTILGILAGGANGSGDGGGRQFRRGTGQSQPADRSGESRARPGADGGARIVTRRPLHRPLLEQKTIYVIPPIQGAKV